MTYALSYFGGAGWQFVDNSGTILSGGKLYVYEAGTTTPLNTYTDNSGGTANPNPIILDSAGRPPAEIWIVSSKDAKFVVKTSSDTLIRTYDNIPAVGSASALSTILSGNALTYDSRAAAIASTIPASVDFVTVGGYYAAGDGGAAPYQKVGSPPAHDGKFQSADGAWWELCSISPDVKMFGAKGDFVQDDTTYIQAAVNYALYKSYPVVTMPKGKYKTTDTIHLGFGVSYSTIGLMGPNAAGQNGQDAWIYPTFINRPVINIQGGRSSAVWGIQIHNDATALPYSSPWIQSLAACADATNYYPVGTKVDAYAPFCGVCIDGYSGTAPANPYPIPTYPSWMTQPATPAAAYGKVTSSHCYVNDNIIQATHVGVCLQPNSDQNGDFMDFSRNGLTQVRTAFSVGNVNARNTNFSNNRIAICHTVFDNTTFRGTSHYGNLGGIYDNLSLDNIYRMFNAQMDWSVPFTVTNCYSENMMRIGDFAGAQGNVGFDGGSFELYDSRFSGAGYPNEAWAEPAATGQNITLRFSNLSLLYSLVAFKFTAQVEFDNVFFQPFTALDSSRASTDEREAAARFATLLPIIQGSTPAPAQIMKNCMVYPVSNSRTQYSSIDYPSISAWHSTQMSQAGCNIPYMQPMIARAGIYATALASPTISGRDVIISSPYNHWKVGDTCYATGYGGTWYYVSAVSGAGPYSVTLTALSNYKKAAGGAYSLFDAAAASGDLYYWPKDALKTIQNYKFYSTTAGSATVNIIDGAGSAAAPPADIAVGDKVLWVGVNSGYINSRKLPFDDSKVVSAIGGTSITMSANAKVTGIWHIGPGIARADI